MTSLLDFQRKGFVAAPAFCQPCNPVEIVGDYDFEPMLDVQPFGLNFPAAANVETTPQVKSAAMDLAYAAGNVESQNQRRDPSHWIASFVQGPNRIPPQRKRLQMEASAHSPKSIKKQALGHEDADTSSYAAWACHS